MFYYLGDFFECMLPKGTLASPLEKSNSLFSQKLKRNLKFLSKVFKSFSI